MSDGTIASGEVTTETTTATTEAQTTQATQTTAADETTAATTDTSQQQTGPWGDDWREKLANGDDKKLKALGRFASPEALWAAQEEAQRKISEGLKPKAKPGEKATAEEWAAWRKDNNIPEAVDDYVKAIPM